MTLASNTQMMYWNQHRSRLPEGYREVEYIESTGVQWIDTGVVPIYMDEVTLTLEQTNVTVQNRLWGFASSSYNTFLGLNNPKHSSWAGHTVYVDWFSVAGNGTAYSNTPVPANTSVTFNIGSFGFTSSLGHNVTRPATTPIAQIGDKTAYLCATHLNSGASVGAYMKVYAMMHKRNGTPVRSYVPCVRISDSKPGLYDLCGSICPLTNSPFYINSGTGADFTWGELA